VFLQIVILPLMEPGVAGNAFIERVAALEVTDGVQVPETTQRYL
jgi:hypothetical protein